MSITAIIVLIAIGLLLILIEIFLLPGINVAGIVGVVLVLGGIIFAYRDLQPIYAHVILAGTLVASVGSIIIAMRAGTWKKISLNETIDSKIINVDPNIIKTGDTGKTISRLNPMGKVLINDNEYEAKSGHIFIDPNTQVVVTAVEGNVIVVKPI